MWLLIVVANVILGIIVNHYWYQKKLERLENQLRKDRNDSSLEFGDFKEVFWTFLMIILPLFVIAYEKKTGFRQWKYPFCSPEWKEMPKDAKMQFLR